MLRVSSRRDHEMTEPSDFQPAGFFVLRTPLLPFDELLDWAEGLEAPRALGDPAELERALASDRARLRERLRAAVERPEVRDALFVASPDLDANFDRWLADPDRERGRRSSGAPSRGSARRSWPRRWPAASCRRAKPRRSSRS